MADEQRFMTAEGTPLPFLQVNGAGQLMIPPDTFSAIRCVLAALDTDDATLFEILKARPALPLLSGLMSLVIGLGERAYGDRLRQALDLLALTEADDDPYGAVAEYRQERSPS